MILYYTVKFYVFNLGYKLITTYVESLLNRHIEHCWNERLCHFFLKEISIQGPKRAEGL